MDGFGGKFGRKAEVPHKHTLDGWTIVGMGLTGSSQLFAGPKFKLGLHSLLICQDCRVTSMRNLHKWIAVLLNLVPYLSNQRQLSHDCSPDMITQISTSAFILSESDCIPHQLKKLNGFYSILDVNKIIENIIKWWERKKKRNFN